MSKLDDAIRLIRKRTPSANNSLLIKTLQTAKKQEAELKELKRQLPNLLKTAIQCGYGVEHTGDVELQEKQIVDELLSKVGI